ncbi:hypothetical protein D9M69_694000 [compost metagenome]
MSLRKTSGTVVWVNSVRMAAPSGPSSSDWSSSDWPLVDWPSLDWFCSNLISPEWPWSNPASVDPFWLEMVPADMTPSSAAPSPVSARNAR